MISTYLSILAFIVFFAIAVAAWKLYCRKPQYKYLGLATLTIAGAIFIFFAYRDAINTDRRIERARELYIQQAENPNYLDTIPIYRIKLVTREQEYLSKYEWSDGTLDLLDPKNLKAAGDIFQNVLLSKFFIYRNFYPNDEGEVSVYDKLIRGNAYIPQGTLVSAEIVTDPLIIGSFTPKSDYDLWIHYYGYLKKTSAEFAVIYPSKKGTENKQISSIGDFDLSHGVYIGDMLYEGRMINVFMNN